MSEEKLPAAVLEVEGDITGFEAKMARAETVARRFEEGAVRSAGRASEAMKRSGDGAGEGADKIDAATKRTIAALERQIAQMSLSRAGYAAFLADQRGVAEQVYAPLVARLAQADAAQRRAATGTTQLGASYKLTAQQAQQLSYQLNDLFVQIASGGNPLMALVQQGSQLNGTFGGIGGTMRALATLITPTTVAITTGVGAVLGLGLAYKQGSEEQDRFARSLVLTGNATGTTIGQLNEMAKAVGNTVGTRGQAAQVLAQLAGAAGMAGSSLQLATEAAIRLQKVGGPAVEETAKQFSALARDPAKAAAKLNEETNFLTVELYRQIKALQDQGQQQAAAALATESYAKVVNDRAKELEARLGTLETAWSKVAGAAKSAWDGMMDIGRPQTLEEQLKAAQDELANRQARGPRRTGALGVAAAHEKRNELLRATIDQLRMQIYMEGEVAAAASSGAEATRKAIAADGERTRQIKAQAAEMERLRDAGRKLLADSAEQLQLTEAEATGRGALTDAQKDALRMLTALRDGTVALMDAEKQQLAGNLQARIAAEALVRARKEAAEALQAMERIAAPEKQAAEDIRRQAEAQIEANRAIGLNTAELRALEQAKLDNAEASAQLRLQDALATGNVVAAEQIERQIADLQRLRQAKLDAYSLTDAAQMRANAERAAAGARKAFDDLFDPARAKNFGDVISESFGNVGNALGRVTAQLDTYGRKQAEIDKARAGIDQDNPYDRYYNGLRLATEEQRNQVQLYGQLISTSKSFFAEGSNGYRTMQALEAAFTIAQLAGAFQRSTATATEVVLNQGKGDPYTAWARMAAMAAAVAQLGFATGFFGSSGGGSTATAEQRQGGAATGRVITADQANAAALVFVRGTVLGEPSAQSESIARSIDALETAARAELDYSRDMLASLRSIEASLSGLGNLVVRSAGGGLISGDNLDIFEGVVRRNRGDPALNALGFSPVASERISEFIAGWFAGPVGVALVKPLQRLWGKTTQAISDAGLSLFGDIGTLSSGRGVQQYADVATTTSSWFGLRKKTNTDTVFGDVDAQIARQFGLVFDAIGDSIVASAGVLGSEVGQAFQDRVAGFLVDIPRLSLKGLEGDELQAAINAAISSIADDLADTVLPGLADFQVIGEGYYETVVRVASGIELAGYQLDQLGIAAVDYAAIARKQGDVAAEIVRQSVAGYETLGGALTTVGAIISSLDGSAEELAETYLQLTAVRTALLGVGIDAASLTTHLMRGAGGLEALSDSLATYTAEFFTQAERQAAQQAALVIEFAKLGVGMPTSREAFRQLVTTLANAGEQGQRTAGKLLGLAGALDEVFDVADAAAERRSSERLSLEQRLLQLQGDTAELRRREREALDASNRALYDHVTALEDQQAALRDQAAALQQAAALEATWASTAAALTSGVQSAFGAVQSAIEAERGRLQSQADETMRALEADAQRVRSSWEGLLGGIAQSMAALDGQLAGDGGRAQALRVLRQASGDLRAGRSVDTEAVRSAAQTVASLGTDGYSSRLEYQRALASTAGLLRDVGAGARDAMAAELARIAAAQAAAEKLLGQQVAALDLQLEEARKAASTLVSIDSGVKSVAGAMAALAAAISAASYASGRGGAGAETNAWIASGGTEVWGSSAGAVGMRPVGSEDPSALLIKGKQSTFTAAEARLWVTEAIMQGREAELVAKSIAEGIDSRSLDALMGWSPGTALDEARKRGLPAFATGTAYVPRTGLALVHEGERILPAADNAALMRLLRGEGRQSSDALLRQLTDVVDQRLTAVMSGIHAVASSTGKLSDLQAAVVYGGASITTRAEA